MKYCTKCGKEVHDEAIICPGCGCRIEADKAPQINGDQKSDKARTSKILGILALLILWPLGIPAIVLANSSKSETGGVLSKDAKTGLICGIIGIVWGAIAMIYILGSM